jgi:PPOX class F420-dependent enzyme/OxyR family protein
MTIDAADETLILTVLNDASRRYLASQQRGRLATVGPDGTPQNKPVGYTYNTELGTIDIGGFEMDASAKYRNIGANPYVAFVVDDAVSEGAAGMRFLEIRGLAERVSLESPPTKGLSSQIIRIHPHRAVSWNVDPDRAGMQSQDLLANLEGSGSTRPSLDAEGSAAQGAHKAVVELVEELQAGWDRHDADITDRPLASDVLWGSPYGATLQGYEKLHDIHIRLKEQDKGGLASRFEIVGVLAPVANVAVAQVRRVALDAEGHVVEPTAQPEGAFSEMALYVLVRRGRRWWLAAGQNTPLRPLPS